MSSPEFHFDRFRVDPRQRQVWDGDTPLALGARGFDLLLALLETPGRALTRDELFARVWPDRVVADENLKMQVMALRRTLGAATIVTVPRVGYRIGCDVRRVEAAAPAGGAPASAPSGRGPPASLLGRESAWQRARAAMERGRLVTLTGPGGVGKTQLALALAEASASAAPAPATDLADGVLELELADHGDGSQLPLLLARAARLAENPAHASAEGIARAVRPLSLLVLLDNCEHLLAAASALAAALLQHAPRVRLLATSQEPLGLPEEQVITLAPLEVTTEAGQPGAAMQLFAERAARADPAFRLTAANAARVEAICRRLDGLPLAIELAAARVALLGVAGVQERLGAVDDAAALDHKGAAPPLALLARSGADASHAPARHRTLRAALRWSVELLDAAERRLFARLGVFVGGFDLDAVAAIDADDQMDPLPAGAAAGGDAASFAAIDRLGSLVAKSLVQVVDAGETKRYRLLEGARAYALELLAEAPERGEGTGSTPGSGHGKQTPGSALAAARHAHARWVCRRFEAAEADAFGNALLVWTAPLFPELGNLRAALRWALSSAGRAAAPQLAAALAAAGTVPWIQAGLDDDARALLDAATALLDGAPAPLAARGWLAVANRGTDFSLTPAAALAAARRALEHYRALGDAEGAYRSLALVLTHGQRTTEPLDVDALLAEMRALEQPHWTPMQRRTRRWPEARQLWRRDGDWVAYRDAFRREALACREAGNALFAWQATHNVVLAEIVLGRPREAAALAAAMVEEIRAAGQERRQWPSVAVHTMACICSGDLTLATPAVRSTLPLLRLADAVWWLGDHLAWWLAMVGHVEAAARAAGWMAERRRVRGEPPSPQSRMAIAALDALLADRLDAGARATLARAGDGDDDVAHAVLLALEAPTP